jgi:hypothetical protein
VVADHRKSLSKAETPTTAASEATMDEKKVDTPSEKKILAENENFATVRPTIEIAEVDSGYASNQNVSQHPVATAQASSHTNAHAKVAAQLSLHTMKDGLRLYPKPVSNDLYHRFENIRRQLQGPLAQ